MGQVRFIAGFSQFIDRRFETLQPNRHQNCPKCNLLQSSSRFKNLVQPSRWEACWLTIKVMGCGPDGINIRLPTLLRISSFGECQKTCKDLILSSKLIGDQKEHKATKLMTIKMVCWSSRKLNPQLMQAELRKSEKCLFSWWLTKAIRRLQFF